MATTAAIGGGGVGGIGGRRMIIEERRAVLPEAVKTALNGICDAAELHVLPQADEYCELITRCCLSV